MIVGRRYDTGEPVSITLAAGCISRIDSAEAPHPQPLPWVAPGFVDLQVNGYGGRDFTSSQLTIDEVTAISLGLDRHGVTGYLPTVTTNSFAIIEHALRTIARAYRERLEVARRVLGIHVEGPYISPEDGPRGAHPREHCRPPSWDEFARWQEAAAGHIRLLTLSPEYDEAPDFIRRVVESGVLVAIGHTQATASQIRAAVDAGARMSTHLGNGAHPVLRRHPNYLWDQLAEDRLVASIIADGHHLPAAVVKAFTRCKTPERLVLVSDMTGMAGMPAGRYATSLGEVEVLENGKLVVAGQRDLLAGAALPIEHCVANMLRYTDVQLRDAVAMASSRPARLIGAAHDELRTGAAANLVVFDLPSAEEPGPLRIRQTYNHGEPVFDATSNAQ